MYGATAPQYTTIGLFIPVRDLSLNLHSEKNIYHAIIYFYIILIISEINMIDIFLKGISHTYTTKNRVSLINKIVE